MDQKKMHQIELMYRDNECVYSLSIESKNILRHYIPSDYALRSDHLGSAEKTCRYINFMDHNDLIKSQSLNKYGFGIQTLTHVIPNEYGYVRMLGFDHTTSWKRKGDDFPLFIITEPYENPNKKELKCWHKTCEKWNLEFKIFPPSPKSLWCSSTYMIFWWCPDYYTFEDRLMEHEDFDDLKKRLTYKKRPTEKPS